VDYILEQEILKKYFKSKYTNTSKYRHILVDEAQDLPGNWLALLDAMLNKKEKSNLWVFEDPFQVVRRNATRPDNAWFKKHSLTKVFRNTHNIFKAYQHCYESLREEVVSIEKSFSNEELSSPSVDHDVHGLSPEYITAENDDQLKDSLLTTLKALHSQGVPFCDVAVITCATTVSYVTEVLKAENVKCEKADKHPALKYTKNKGVSPVFVDSYQRFKGLESKVLIFLIPNGWEPRPMDIYVGFSRSFCHLVVIGTSRMINDIKRLPA
jgi:hypothetical protein